MKTLLSIVLVAVISAQVGFSQVISGDEFVSVANQIIESQAQIQSLQVSFSGRGTTNGETRVRKAIYARSGEKEYCKTFWPTKPDEPDSTRYSLVLWNGKVLMSYESRAHNGTLYAQRPKNQSAPQTYSAVCRYFGHLTKGSLQELLKRIPPEQWMANWVEPGKVLSLTCDAIPRVGSHERSEWLLDVSKGFMISRYRASWQDPKNSSKYHQALEMVVTGDKEVLPGIWIPVQSHVEYKTPNTMPGQKITTISKDLTIDSVLVNDPAIEEVFTFKWPKGSQYYDYTLKCTVIPNATDEAMVERMDEMVKDLMISSTQPTTEKHDEKVKDNTQIVAATRTPSQKKAGGDSHQKPGSFLLWLVPVMIAAAALLIVVAALRRKNKEKGTQS